MPKPIYLSENRGTEYIEYRPAKNINKIGDWINSPIIGWEITEDYSRPILVTGPVENGKFYAILNKEELGSVLYNPEKTKFYNEMSWDNYDSWLEFIHPKWLEHWNSQPDFIKKKNIEMGIAEGVS